jgi:hypothetical protein
LLKILGFCLCEFYLGVRLLLVLFIFVCITAEDGGDLKDLLNLRFEDEKLKLSLFKDESSLKGVK